MIRLPGPKNDVHLRGIASLQAPKLRAVEAQLQHEVRLALPRELGIPRLVAPVPTARTAHRCERGNR